MRSDSKATQSIKPDSIKTGLLGLAVTCALISMQAHAIGLGTIEVKSKLNQPFVAEIPLTLNTPDEANDLVVRLASSEAFARVGMDPRELSANLQFSVGKNARGEPVVRVTTPQRMTDPYVTFLVEADWGKGKMVREYTALLDPPRMAEVPRVAISAPTVASTPLPAPVAAPVTPPTVTPASTAAEQAQQAAPPERSMPIAQAEQPEASAPSAIAPEPLPVPAAEAPMPEAQAAEPSPPPPAPVAETPPAPMPGPAPEAAKPAADAVTVAKGQTLSAIADQVRPTDVSVNRMMIALQRANPNAFIHSNINLLKSGMVLHIPDSGEAQAVTSAEANALVHEQVESWRQAAQPAPVLQPDETADARVASSSRTDASGTAKTGHAATPKPKSAAEAATTTNKTTTAAAVNATASVPKPSKPRGAHLEIVPAAGTAATNSQTGASEGGSGSELRAQLAQTKEELTARSAEVSDLKSKVTDLEKMQKDSTQLLSMKDSQLAAMQAKLAELQKQQAAAATASSAASTSAEASAMASTSTAPPAASGSVASAAPATVASTASEAPVPEAVASEPPKPVAAAKPKAAIPTPIQPTDLMPWYMQPFALIGGVLVVLAGLLALMLRRPGQPAPAPRSRFDTDALAASIPVVRPAPAPPPAVHKVVHDDAPQAEAAHASSEASAVIVGEHNLAPQPVAVAKTVSPAASPVEMPVAAEEDDWSNPEPAQPVATDPGKTAVRPAVPVGDANPGISTKLELARAYIDIGDHDGARSMLEEVLIEGNATQQEAAFALLDSLDG